MSLVFPTILPSSPMQIFCLAVPVQRIIAIGVDLDFPCLSNWWTIISRFFPPIKITRVCNLDRASQSKISGSCAVAMAKH